MNSGLNLALDETGGSFQFTNWQYRYLKKYAEHYRSGLLLLAAILFPCLLVEGRNPLGMLGKVYQKSHNLFCGKESSYLFFIF